MWKWLFAAVLFITLGVVGILIETPTGNIEGLVVVQQSVTKANKIVYGTDNIVNAKARAIAYGPVVRASFLDSEGKFKINGLPIGKYSVRVRANNYASQTLTDIDVKEKEVKKIKDVKLDYLSGSISLASNYKTFTPSESPYFWFTTTGIKDVDLKLYKFNVEDSLNKKDKDLTDYVNFLVGNYYYGSDDFTGKLIKGLSPIETWQRTPTYSTEDYAKSSFKIDKKLEPGNYLMVASGQDAVNKKEYSDSYWFSVSDLGVVTKHAPEKLLFDAVNLDTLEPAKQANIKIFDRNNKMTLLGEVKTDDKGLAEYKFKKDYNGRESSLVVIAEQNNSFALSGSYSWYYSEDRYKVYTYTDRPIYRPNQTVFFKGIVRVQENEGLKNFVGKPITVKVYNSDDEPIKSMNLETNRFGTYNGFIELPQKTSLGSYRIETRIDDNDYTSYFEVAEYRKPEYKVDVVPGSDIVISGNKTKATIKANYFFGYPVTNAKVKYTVYSSPDYDLRWKLQERPDYYAFFDDWDDDGEDYDSSSGDIVAEGYAITDEAGEAKIEFTTKKLKVDDNEYSGDSVLPQSYRVEAEVTDVSRKTVVGKGRFNVVSGDYALFTDTDYYVYTPDQNIKVTVDAVGFDKKPRKANVKVQLQSWQWNEDEWKYTNPKVVSEVSVDTSVDGKGTAELKIPKNASSSDYRIVAVSQDQNGNDIASMSYVWISNYDYAFAKTEVKPKLKLTLDKKVYQAGDTAKVVIVSPVKDKKVQALVTLEGLGLYEYYLVDMPSNTKMITVPIKKAYMPNMFVSVSIVGPKKQFYSDSKMVKISPDNNFLKVDVKPDKKKYKPAEFVKYTIKVTDSKNKPVQAEFSMGVVDESVYAVREDFTADIRKFFYSQIYNAVSTEYSFAEDYSAGGDKIEPRVRKDFKDTAFWKANVKTDKNGIAKVKFKLPDNLTTWRTTLRTVTSDTKVASVTDSLLVTQDIIVRLALPRFYTVGDKAILAAIVHNYTDNKQDMRLTLKAPGNFKFIGADKNSSMMVQIPSQDKVRHDFNLEAVKAGDSKMTLTAASSKIAGDAVQQDIKILPYGIPKVFQKSGSSSDPEFSKTINQNISDNIAAGTLKWNVNLAASSAGTLLGSLDYLIGYPYGCTEQTMSKFLPSIVAYNVSKSFGVPLSENSRKKLPEIVPESLDILYKNQHDDGGWGWWQYDESSPYMTAYVVYGLNYASITGYNIKTEVMNKGIIWLDNYIKGPEPKKVIDNYLKHTDESYYYNRNSITDLTYECYVLSLFGRWDIKLLDQLYSNKDELQSSALAYLAITYDNIGMKIRAKECVSDLLGRVDVTAPVIGFGILKKFGIMFNYNDPEITAIVMRAILRVEPANPIIPKMVTYLNDNRQDNYWFNTKTTATVVLALADYLKYSYQGHKTNYTVVVKLNGKTIDQVVFDDRNAFAPETVISLPEKLISKANTLTIEKIGDGDLFYTSNLTYYRKYNTDDIIPANNNSDVSIKKEFYRLKASTDKDGNIIYKPYPLTGPAKAGEVLFVKLTVNNSNQGEYLIVEDPKASGMELVSDDPRTLMGSDYESQNSYWWDFWWTHQEDRDAHIAFFVNSLSSGSHVFNYLIRPEFPGEYQIRPTTVEGMYSTLLKGNSQSYKLTVKE